LRPNAAEVLLGLGSFYLLAPPIVGGDRNKAEDYLKRALLADPFLADTYVRLAQLYKIQGDNVKYELYLNEALKIDPQSELALDIKNKQCKFVCP
jgi:Tfp pilus assembly protein PilF